MKSKSPFTGRRKFWWLLLLAGIALTVALLVVLSSSPKPMEELEAVRRAGLPITPAELDKWYPQVEEEENAALVILQAIEEHRAPSAELNSTRLPEPGESLSAGILELLQEHLQENAPALELIHSASALPKSRYPVDLSLGATVFPTHLAPVKSLATLVRYDVVYHADTGDAERALHSVLGGLAIADSLKEEPLVISELVRIACLAIAVTGLEHLLSKQELNKAQLIELGNALDNQELSISRTGFRALVGERVFRVSQFSSMQPAGWWAPYEMFGLADRDLRIYLQMMEQLVDAMSNPFPRAYNLTWEAEKEMDERFSGPLGRFALMSRGVLPSLVKVVGKEAAILTRLRCARAALAAELYRLDHGSIPREMKQLIPDYLQEELLDPVDGEPLELRLWQTRQGYEVLSPGAAEKLQNKRDTVFTVYR